LRTFAVSLSSLGRRHGCAYRLLVTATGWYRLKRPIHRGNFLIYCASASEFKSCLIHPLDLSRKYQERHLVAKLEETWREKSSSPCFQTSSKAHPAPYTMSTVGPFPGGKARPGHEDDHSHHLVPMSRTSRSYIFFPSWCLHCVAGQPYSALLLISEVLSSFQVY
jgi:hypothetical protein